MNDIKVGRTITYEGGPYVVTRAEHSKQARAAAVLRTKLKNLITGQVLEVTFSGGDTVAPADLERKESNFQYSDETEYTFMDNGTYDQFTLPRESVGDVGNYIKEGQDVDVMYFEGKPVSVAVAPKVVLQVVEAPPGVKGDSAGNVTKKVKVETGYELNVPLFIEQGEKIRINTDTGDYVERAND